MLSLSMFSPIKKMMKILGLAIVLVISLGFGSPTKFDSIILPLISTSSNGYELPPQNSVVNTALEEAKLLASGQTPKIPTIVAQELNSVGYALEIKSFGDCGTSNADGGCGAVVIGRRFFTLVTSDLKKASEIYTQDLREPNDKSLKFHGITIERHHWEIKDGLAFKVSESLGPMLIADEYRIKKCRDGFMVSWKCNTISYKLFELDESTIVLLGRQLKTDSEPSSYQIQKCEKPPCSERFLDGQKHNNAAGTLSFVVFKAAKDQKGKNIVKVSEANFGSTTDPSEVRRMDIAQSEMRDGLGSEYRILSTKFRGKFPDGQNNRDVTSVPSEKGKLQLTRGELWEVGLGCFLLLPVVLFLTRKFSKFYNAD